jgi:SAM-dependent methyltransferase
MWAAGPVATFAGCRHPNIGLSEYRIIGLDLSRNMLRRARELLGARHNVSLVQASATCLPFRAGSVDRIMSGLVIDHVASIEQLFREMWTVLTANGHAVLAAVHPDMQCITGSDIDIPGHGQQAIHIPGHVHQVEYLLDAARKGGMTMVAMDGPPITPVMLKHRPAWKNKVGHSALSLLALAKSGST